jgi:hypothetical protein
MVGKLFVFGGESDLDLYDEDGDGQFNMLQIWDGTDWYVFSEAELPARPMWPAERTRASSVFYDGAMMIIGGNVKCRLPANFEIIDDDDCDKWHASKHGGQKEPSASVIVYDPELDE